MSPKLVYFLSIFLAYFLKFMIHFYAELWNTHQLFVLQVLNENEIIPVRKVENWPGQNSLSRHIFIMSQQNPTRTRRSYGVTRIKLNLSQK